MAVKETREILAALKAFVKVAGEVMEDGKFNMLDFPRLALMWGPLQDAINGANAVPDEWRTATEEEMRLMGADALDVVFAVLAMVKKPT